MSGYVNNNSWISSKFNESAKIGDYRENPIITEACKDCGSESDYYLFLELPICCIYIYIYKYLWKCKEVVGLPKINISFDYQRSSIQWITEILSMKDLMTRKLLNRQKLDLTARIYSFQKTAIENVGVACNTGGFLRHVLYCLSDVS